jgi:type II secretory pathway component PulF
MRFRYIASQPNGKVTEGTVEAATPAQVLEWMGTQNLRPISLKAIETKKSTTGLQGLFKPAITVDDLVFLTKYLSLMLRVGTDLFHAIDILIADFDKPVVKSLLIEIRDNLGQGKPFYSTFAKYPQHFSSVFINLIKAGEATGSLDRVFSDLSTGLEKEKDLRNRIKAAVTYPILLLVFAFIILLSLVAFALPKISKSFSQGGQAPPAFSAAVFAFGDFVGGHIGIILLFIVSSIFGTWFFLSKTQSGKKFGIKLLNRMPIVGPVLKQLALQRFASTFASLLKAGLPMLESLEITANAVGSEELKEILLRIARQGVAKGITVGEAFRREPYFPRVVVNLIAISEKAGHMEEILETLADFYASDVDSKIKLTVSFIEPVLLIMIGLIVMVIALAVIVPIYQLVSSI